jgi:predicted esterase
MPERVNPIESVLVTPTHGRYIVVRPDRSGPAPMLVGFHGYAEGAEAQLERMRAIPESRSWVVVSIQGLHRFYQSRSETVVASWMTRQDREFAIADNVGYVAAVVQAVRATAPTTSTTVFAGFSQGVAMAFRAAVAAPAQTSSVIAVGGDIPPELEAATLRRLSAVLLCRGLTDEWYTAETFEADARRLKSAAVAFQTVQYRGGHEWSSELIDAAGRFLRDGGVSRKPPMTANG